jgi:hypothetical protein
MKMKKLGLLLLAAALSTAALVGGSGTAQAMSACKRPSCGLLSPGCCSALECAAWCVARGLGAPQCSGNGQGGCCSCESP